jgi:hypothetical protein
MARVTVLTISGTYDLTSGTLLISLQGEVVVVDSELPDDLPSTSRPPAISIDPPPPSRRNPLLRMSDVFVRPWVVWRHSQVVLSESNHSSCTLSLVFN